MTVTLRQQAEFYLGSKIKRSEWGEAKAYAERKLALIIQRYGDAEGARRKRNYLAQLIAEAVQGERLSQFTLGIAEELREGKQQKGLKKGQPAHNDASRPNLYSPIVSQV